MKVSGPFYLGLQKVWPIVASQVFSSTYLGLTFVLPKVGSEGFGPLLLGLSKSLAHVARQVFWFHSLRPPIFLAQNQE